MDWLVVILIGLFGIRGLVRGTIGQVFGIIGLLAGLWAAGWIARWVGELWSGARPAAVFLVLRWLVAGLGGLAVAAFFGWWGETIARAARSSPAGWLDRLGGFVLGAGLGTVVAMVTVLVALSAPLLPETSAWARESLLPAPLMRGGAWTVSHVGGLFPGSGWLEQRFRDAATRAGS